MSVFYKILKPPCETQAVKYGPCLAARTEWERDVMYIKRSEIILRPQVLTMRKVYEFKKKQKQYYLSSKTHYTDFLYMSITGMSPKKAIDVSARVRIVHLSRHVSKLFGIVLESSYDSHELS